MKPPALFVTAVSILLSGMISRAEIQVVFERNRNEEAVPDFKFKNVPRPARNDAAANATFTLLDGRRDANGGDLARLHDGKLPAEEDAPADNFFFNAGTAGGRLLVDLGKAIEIKQVNTYSWHANTRAPQVYVLHASDGKASGFHAQPKQGTDPESCGWRLVAKVDTRPKTGPIGGQYGVSISDSSGSLGTCQFLLFDISRTEDDDAFGNTFFSEIDVIDRQGPAPEPVPVVMAQEAKETVPIDGGKCTATIDTSETPDLTEWARKELMPMVREWYPKLVKLLPSEGYEAPTKFSIIFSKNMQGVAATSGTRIRCAASWIRRNLKSEAVGAIFHEMVHVVQQYGRTRRAPGTTRPPGWLTEGITDYLRWYLYEPQSHGAEITKRNLSRPRYDGSYRITANFLNWVSEQHGKEFITKLNAAIREGKYSEETWKTLTSHTVQELGVAWKAEHEKRLGADATTAAAPASPPTAPINTLTDAEQQAGWQKPLLRAHSHNDYQHARPLLDALDHGFCSIEADVFLVNGQLLVAHDRDKTSPERTLQRLYLDPLRERARQHGGRIYPGGPVCLLFIDLKTEAESTYAVLDKILRDYADLVTRFEDGRATTNALVAVITGNRPRQTITAQSPRFAACDGLAPDLDSDVSPLLVPVVSEQWSQFFRWRGQGTMPPEELARLKEFVGKAHARGRKLRLWGAPDLPAAWRALYESDVDLLNTDNHSGLRDFLLAAGAR